MQRGFKQRIRLDRRKSIPLESLLSVISCNLWGDIYLYSIVIFMYIIYMTQNTLLLYALSEIRGLTNNGYIFFKKNI